MWQEELPVGDGGRGVRKTLWKSGTGFFFNGKHKELMRVIGEMKVG